ncbi:hypothetical protein FHS95_000926 [Sphingomonas naasensis]|jgi:hypothetical protein|nr:hypothetical protein [Sphingomonas naasensis]NIJ19257.1 hypothetical protein [Sphingomonas naasensis]
MLLLAVAMFSFADLAVFSGRHLAGIGDAARDQIESVRVKADEYSRKPI